MYLIHYIIEYYCEIDNEMITQNGLLFAENLREATVSLEKYYGEDSIESLRLEYLNDTPVLELPEDLIDGIKKTL